MKKRPAANGPLPPQTLTKVLVGSVPATPVTTVDPRWTGYPYGCSLDHHEHDWPPDVARCNYCLALDYAAREALVTCWDVCPARVGEAS
jgi:hypothetical protein